MRRLEDWLHRPAGTAGPVDVAALLKPYQTIAADELGRRRGTGSGAVRGAIAAHREPTDELRLSRRARVLGRPVLLVAWVWRRSGGRVALPLDHGGHSSGRGWAVALAMAESVPALILAVVIVLLAGPQQLMPRGTSACSPISSSASTSRAA